MPLASIRDTQIYFEIVGDGTPLVLVTGQGSGPEGRAELINALARSHSVLTYDQRGTGRSDRGPEGQPIPELAEDIVALMDHVGFASAHIVGHSTGTGMATVVAATYPERTSGLVLAAPWTHADDHLRTIQEMRKAAARTMPPAHYAQFNALLLYPPEFRRANSKRFAEMAEAALRTPQDATSISARLDAILAFDARPSYPRIARPTLVLSARDDQVMPYWFADHAAQAIPDAQLIAFDGGGHMFVETRTRDVLDVIIPFLDAVV
ncbi:MAG: alpha/beta fold hydrolase [Methyloligellaceae bacterium]